MKCFKCLYVAKAGDEMWLETECVRYAMSFCDECWSGSTKCKDQPKQHGTERRNLLEYGKRGPTPVSCTKVQLC